MANLNGLTLHDLTVLREQIKEEIAEILASNCEEEKWYSAKELEYLVNGKGSKYHFANTFSGNYDCGIMKYKTDKITLTFFSRLREQIKKCAYLDEEDNIIGTFEIKEKSILEYQLIRVDY